MRTFFYRASVVALGLLMAAAVFAYCRQRLTSTGLYRTEYEGRIVNKSVSVRETNTGSYPVRKLHVRGSDGQEFEVIVNENLYGRAQTGMWVKSSNAGAELNWEGH